MIKGLPLESLAVTAVATVVDFEESDNGNEIPIIEMDVLDAVLWEKFRPVNQACRCAMCGHSLKIACAVTHTPTGDGYWIGRDCATSIPALQRAIPNIQNATVALAQRIACDRREAQWLERHPDALGVVQWSKRASAPRISQDICSKLRRFGEISDKQLDVLEMVRQQDIDRRTKATGKAKAGRQAFSGTILSLRSEYSTFQRGAMVTKALVDLGNGVRYFGNLPEQFVLTEESASRAKLGEKAGEFVPTHEFVRVGDRVEMKATIEPKAGDDLFGFWKRPASFVLHPAQS